MKDFLQDCQIINVLLREIDDQIYSSETEESLYENGKPSSIQDLMICCLLSLNNHFMIPCENKLLELIKTNSSTHTALTEIVLKIFRMQRRQRR